MKPCPDCGARFGYSESKDACGDCGRGVAEAITEPNSVTATVTPVKGGAITRPGPEVTERIPVEGEPCPSCGKPFGKSKAQLQREYRARVKEKNAKSVS